ncbi:NAD-dependent epimerase/dehydratase family protein [Desulfotomaculum sp. 1211_IL3151]|uniref:NAD-dependent epimerase/dehydratase family protein n=1 Tax=Desulfotomaculum sp. 1211_IL3151 TaxID=3084055 RepID=UPI002FDAC06C
MPKALITGVNGFLGSHLKTFLTQQNIEVFGLGRNISGDNNYYRLDLSEKEKLLELLQEIQPEYIFHTAGIIFSRQIQDYYFTNVIGTINLLEAVVRLQYKPRVLSIGTSAEYGSIHQADLPLLEDYIERPYNHYGISKLAQTKVCLEYGRKFNLPISIARIFNLLGSGISQQLAVGSFVQQIKACSDGGTIEVGNLSAARDYLDVRDAARMLWQIVNHSNSCEIFNVCSGKAVTMQYILQNMIKISGKKVTIEQDLSRMKPIDLPMHYGSNKKIRKLFGKPVTFTSLEESLQTMLNYEK